MVVYKAFKYFDLNDSGTVDRHEFMKAIERIGMWMHNQKQINVIFDYYDVDANGGLDYYEFIGKIYKVDSKVPRNKMNLSGLTFRIK